MGRPKLLEPIDGRRMIDRALAAAGDRPVVVVASPVVAAALTEHEPRARVVVNDAPERGMNHSLALADAAIAPHEPIAVLLADLPDCDAATVDAVAEAYADDVDVVVPRAGERLGHPVVFGPAARGRIAGLVDGDGLRSVRDDPALRRRYVDLASPGAFTDIDTPEQLAARRGTVTHDI